MADKGLISGENKPDHKLIIRENNFSLSTKKNMFGIRIFVMISALVFSISNAATAWAVQKKETVCIYDGLFIATQPLNDYFAEKETLKHVLMIISSALIDINLSCFTYQYIFYGDTWRPIIFMFMFYLFRSLLQSIFVMKFPDDNIWEYPGFPSMTVTYEKTTDFFYSGHVGVMVFCALLNRSLQNRFLTYLSISAACFEFFVLLITRAHYSVDLIAGVIFAHYFWILSGWLSPFVDNRLGYKEITKDYLKLA